MNLDTSRITIRIDLKMVYYTIFFPSAIILIVIFEQAHSLNQISNFDLIFEKFNIELVQKEIDILKTDTNETKCLQDISTWLNSLKNKDRWAWESKATFYILFIHFFIYLKFITLQFQC